MNFVNVIYKKINQESDKKFIAKEYRSEVARSILQLEKFEDISYVEIASDEMGTLWCFCDGEGLMKNLAENIVLPMSDGGMQLLVGDVGFVRAKKLNPYEESYDYEVVPLYEKDVELINNILNEETQMCLKEWFENAE